LHQEHRRVLPSASWVEYKFSNSALLEQRFNRRIRFSKYQRHQHHALIAFLNSNRHRTTTHTTTTVQMWASRLRENWKWKTPFLFRDVSTVCFKAQSSAHVDVLLLIFRSQPMAKPHTAHWIRVIAS
jgi:hypothetical protein